jgi:hypothetical protein
LPAPLPPADRDHRPRPAARRSTWRGAGPAAGVSGLGPAGPAG